MKMFTLVFCIFSVLYQANCAFFPSPLSVVVTTDGEDSIGYSSDSSTRSYGLHEATGLYQVKRPRLWDIREDIPRLKAVEDFWEKVFEGKLEEAEELRVEKKIKISECDSVQALLSDETTSLTTLDYLYQRFPQIFNSPYFENIFGSTRQEVLSHFYENYSGDLNLRQRLVEACSLNKNLTLPTELSTVKAPVKKNRNAKTFKSVMRSKSLTKPKTFSNKQVGSLTLEAADFKMLDFKEDNQVHQSFETSPSSLNTYLKGKLFRKGLNF